LYTKPNNSKTSLLNFYFDTLTVSEKLYTKILNNLGEKEGSHFKNKSLYIHRTLYKSTKNLKKIEIAITLGFLNILKIPKIQNLN